MAMGFSMNICVAGHPSSLNISDAGDAHCKRVSKDMNVWVTDDPVLSWTDPGVALQDVQHVGSCINADGV